MLVQREMECGRSPLVSIARVSAGRGAADATVTGTRKQGRNCNWLQKEIRVDHNSHLVHRTQTSLRSVRAVGWA